MPVWSNEPPPLHQTPPENPHVQSLQTARTKYTPRSAPEGTAPIPISPATMIRMVYEHEPKQPSTSGGSETSWKPSRPARPPSPELKQFVAPSPPVILRERPSVVQEVSLNSTFSDSQGVTQGASHPPNRPRSGSNSSKKPLRSHVPGLTKLFHRKSDEKGGDDGRSLISQISMPVQIESEVQPLPRPQPVGNQTEQPTEFGVLTAQSPDLQQSSQGSSAGRHSKSTGFGRKLFKSPFSPHNRSASSSKMSLPPGASMSSGMQPPQLPPRARVVSAPIVEGGP